jgi:cyclophilin family peptidyl-prolyl cis-trans isomerase
MHCPNFAPWRAIAALTLTLGLTLMLQACGGGTETSPAQPQQTPASLAISATHTGHAKALATASSTDSAGSAGSVLVDQAITLQDAIAILKIIVGLDINADGKPPTPYQVYAADFDANGSIELADAIGVLKHVVGLASPTPQWMFFNPADPALASKTGLNPGAVPTLNTIIPTSASTAMRLVAALRGDVVGDPMSYSWSLNAKPNGSAAALVNSTQASPSFTPDVAGAYVASLVVTDGKQNSATISITVNALLANTAPVANAGAARQVEAGSNVTLNAAASSDAEGDALTYLWTLLSKPTDSRASLNNPTAVAPSFVPDVAGAYVFGLTVSDGKLASATVNQTITAVITPAIISLSADRLSYGRISNFVMTGDKMTANGVTLGVSGCDNPVLLAGGSATQLNFTCTPNRLLSVRVTAKFDGKETYSPTLIVPKPQVTMTTTMGAVVVELEPASVPVTVDNFLAYVNSGFYNGTIFHRVIKGFMNQGGGFTAVAAGSLTPQTGLRSPIALEVNVGLSNLKYSIAMARTSVLNSATAQFFINAVDNLFLDTSGGGYAVFGKVVSGQTVIDAMNQVSTRTVGGYSDVPAIDITVQKAEQTQ